MERKEVIRSAYRLTGGNSFYDGMITCSTLSGKAVCRLVWDMNKAECDAYLEKALSGIPERFSGRLLEVPVGTGILTMPVYQTPPEADITCQEVLRVLKPGGTFCGCFYVRGEHRRTDWFIRRAYERSGFFTPPYGACRNASLW